MRATALLGAVLLALAGQRVLGAEARAYKADAGASAVAALEADWKDAARNVTVPVKIYFPRESGAAQDPLPLIIFSHGLGGSREGYSMWASHWASWGYVVVLPTHVGSDTSVLLAGVGAMREAMSVENALRRAADVKFIIAQMDKVNAGALDEKDLVPLKGRLDLKHIGMAGHSFGAETTLIIAGQGSAVAPIAVEPRVTAAIAMSPQPALRGDQKVAFGSIKIPVFHVTGTADDSPPQLNTTKAADRRIPFDNSPCPDTYLVIYKGAIHMTFAPSSSGVTLGARLRQPQGGNTPEEEANIHTLIKESTTAFWDAYLKGDETAKAWLAGNFARVMGAAGTFETRKK